jgi:predicted transcriptional regulator
MKKAAQGRLAVALYIYYIRHMSNMSTHPLPAQTIRFIDDMASHLIALGMTLTVARLYAYLVLSDAPVTLDQIAQDLEMSKSSASVAARHLESYKLTRCHSERGSKRLLYEPVEDTATVLAAQSEALAAIGKMLQHRAPTLPPGKVAQRLDYMAHSYLSMHDSVAKTISALNAHKTTPGGK